MHGCKLSKLLFFLAIPPYNYLWNVSLMLKGELDDTMAELEECRRKLINLKMQKDVASGMHFPCSGAANGNLSPEKSAERTISMRDLKNSIEETRVRHV